jgi:hypothetical protein
MGRPNHLIHHLVFNPVFTATLSFYFLLLHM